MGPEDRELVARFLERRDEEAFRLIYRRHSPRLYALALRLLGGRVSEAEDVLQETWRRAATQLPRFEWRAALSTWLHSVLINCLREQHRARHDEDQPIDDAAEVAGARPASPAASLDLERAIASLSARCRDVLVLHDIEGYTHKEIADLLGIAAGTSKSELFRARQTLRARFTAARAQR